MIMVEHSHGSKCIKGTFVLGNMASRRVNDVQVRTFELPT